ncbi:MULTISPECIES: amidase [Mesorhizobium]|uniref:amidase n=1 Tax=Mesorhizobium TaxID=68287 RepID=UPI0010A966D6|nr:MULTISPECIES: amidase [Mesorhizobium]
MDDFAFLSVTKAASLLAARRISSVEYTRALLDRIDNVGHRLAAFISLDSDAALAAARCVDDQRAAGHVLPALAGIPYAVKDLIDVAGQRTTAQSAASTRLPVRDAAVIRRLREAKAILLGKLTLEEWGIGSPLDPLPWPPARNPWSLDRTPGGSSSGAGVAVSSGLVPLALGTDTAGSVRNPAALCGIVGLKPTRGLVSRAGVVALSRTLDHVGLMARSAQDCRLLLDALTGEHSRAGDLPRCKQPLAGLRFCLPDVSRNEELCSAETRHALDSACGVFERLGASTVTVGTPDFQACYRALVVVLQAEAFRAHRFRLAASPGAFGSRTHSNLMAGAAISAAQYATARLACSAFAVELATTFASCDILVLPPVNGPAVLLDDELALKRAGQGVLRAPFNASGNPALSLCAGMTASGLPLAMQLVGRPGSDTLLLEVAIAFQRVTGWHELHPAL